MANKNLIEQLKKEQEELETKQKELNTRRENAKGEAIAEIKDLAIAFGITFNDVKGIFPQPKKTTSGRKPKAKYLIKDTGAEWAGTGANPPKQFIPFIQKNALHELLVESTPEGIEAAKKYAKNWNEKHKA